MSLSPVDIGAIIVTPVLGSTMAAVYVCLIPYTIARTSTQLFWAVRHGIRASRLLSLKCKLNHKFPRATPTAFDNHPPSNHGSSLGIFWLRYLYHIRLMNYAPNDTFNKTRHICHKLQHFCVLWGI